MADEFVIEVEGRLVGYESRSYESFPDEKGVMVAAGVTRVLHLCLDFDQAPASIKVAKAHEAAFVNITALGFGALVRFRCRLVANGNRMQRVYLDHKLVATAEGVIPPAPAASNGRPLAGAAR